MPIVGYHCGMKHAIAALFALVVLSGCETAGMDTITDPGMECLGSGGAASVTAVTSAGTYTPPTNKTRLRAYIWTTDEGVDIPIAGRWFDSERGEDCYFAATATSDERCLPRATALRPVYSDPKCSVPLVWLSQKEWCPALAPKYVTPWIDPGNECGNKEARYTVGAKASPDAVYMNAEGGCADAAPEQGAAYFDIGEQVPADAFVSAGLYHY